MPNSAQAELRLLANPDIASHSQRFFKTGPGEYGEGDKFLGIPAPHVRAVVKKNKQLTLPSILSLLKSKYHEERLCAVLLLVQKFQSAAGEEQAAIYHSYLKNTEYINNWDIVDSSAHKIIGAYLWQRERSVLKQLARSESLWERRIAIITTYHFIQRDDFTDTLSLAKMLLEDEEDLIHKALGWMLREIGKRNMKTEKVFLAQHYNLMPRTMLRYAIEKFPENQRKKYLTASI